MIVYKATSYFYLGGDEEDERDCVFSSPEKAKEWLINNPYLHDAFMDEYGLDDSPTPEKMKALVEENIENDNITIEKVDFDPVSVKRKENVDQ